MNFQPNAVGFMIDGKAYNNTTPIDSIALSPDYTTFYYAALAGFSLYSIPTSILNGPGLTESVFEKNYAYHGEKGRLKLLRHHECHRHIRMPKL